MELNKAKEILTDLHKVGLNRLTPDEKDAIGLGIEALKYIEHFRTTKLLSPGFKLPGETERR